ncbi:MAG TPA: AbgT family transporter [Pyrinomonadaceae bacterium]|nr:AbgT family transporter [Chloracidobacterium sp.]HBE82415.1 aminobenzoyl-glutamate transporter [Blastocatellia bacterium]HRK48813.1 AbgT family transporter [Pyrinomonadaceae bacterium]
MENTQTEPPADARPDTFYFRILDRIERVGNKIPNPAFLFFILAVLALVLSAVVSWADVSVVHPGTKETIKAVNLLTVEGLHRILTGLITNFTGFAPLGVVLVGILGITVAEASGLIGAVLRVLVMNSPKRLLTAVVVFAGVISNMASDIGYVVLIPLAALMFLAVGRHPLAGLAAAFAGVSGGFSANLLLAPTDALLAGLTQEAARILDPGYIVTPAANYYFLAASTFLVTILGTYITEKVVVPRLGEYKGDVVADKLERLNADEKRGLLYTAIAVAVFVGLILWGTIPEDGFLRDAKTGSLIRSPFLTGIIAIVFFGGVLFGVVYGFASKSFKKIDDVVHAMEGGMRTMSVYLVLAFFAAQFVAFFNWSNLGLILAVEGAEVLRSLELGGITLIISFVILSIILDLFIGSASAKWAVMAPVFVPMLMLLGYSPELTQACYRVGDSVCNIITPLMSYFPLIVAFARKYDPKAGIGTIMSLMIPYSIVFFIGWTLFLVAWYLLELPLGPGAEIFYQFEEAPQ